MTKAVAEARADEPQATVHCPRVTVIRKGQAPAPPPKSRSGSIMMLPLPVARAPAGGTRSQSGRAEHAAADAPAMAVATGSWAFHDMAAKCGAQPTPWVWMHHQEASLIDPGFYN
jgi:hypothetical protein